jgi:formylglycine-generating enzyme required for sulfatase activity
MSLHLYRNNTDEYRVSDMGENANFKAPGSSFLGKKDPFSYDENKIILEGGASFDFYDGAEWSRIPNRGQIEFDPLENLDQGDSYDVGADYFIYLCLPSGGGDPLLLVSKNATFPNGFNSQNSRKIGGFHYGTIRKCVASGDLWVPIDSNGVAFGSSGTKWQDNVTLGIIPNSVWDLKNRPAVLFGGLAKVGGIWLSIYQASMKASISFMNSVNGLHVKSGAFQSKYGQLPVTGTEGCNQYNFNELARFAGMRLPIYDEWLLGAFGSPEGTDTGNSYGWTATANTACTRTGCMVNPSTGAYDVSGGIKPYAVSAYNLCDCVGNIWEWLADTAIRADSISYDWYDVLGEGMGDLYGPNQYNPMKFRAGGGWCDGVHCGPRAVHLGSYAWHVTTTAGARLACDAAA